MSRNVSERAVVLLVAAVQFVNILDFVMVIPMGPDFAAALAIRPSNLGFIGGSYTAAAAISGLLASRFLDRFDRRPALGLAMLGLVLGTALGGLATGLPSLLGARVLAGLFGGPATALSFSIIADVVPPERRGRAMGIVMGAFSVASVIGVPAGLDLAHALGWRAPFFGVAALGAIVALSAVFLLPPMRSHLVAARAERDVSFLVLARQRAVLLSWAMTFVVMMAGFIVIPNISAYVQFNLGYPRAHLDRLYFFGGLVSLAGMQLAGRFVDRFNSFRVGTAGTALLVAAVAGGFVMVPPLVPPLGIIVVFMLAMSFRNVAYNALTTRVPSAGERARFMSIQSAVQHFASAAGAFLAANMLSEDATGRIVGMGTVASVSIALTAALPLFLRAVEHRVKRQELSARASEPMDPVSGIGGAGQGVAPPVAVTGE